MDPRRTATLVGWLFIATFVLSIPAYFILYADVRDTPNLIMGLGADPTASVATGAARAVEQIGIGIGIISLLAFVFMRQEGTGTPALGEAFVAIYDRAFLIGPGFFAGAANGLILGM